MGWLDLPIGLIWCPVCENSSYGKYMRLKALEKICMVILWEQGAHRYSIAMAHLLHFLSLWE